MHNRDKARRAVAYADANVQAGLDRRADAASQAAAALRDYQAAPTAAGRKAAMGAAYQAARAAGATKAAAKVAARGVPKLH